MRVVRWIHYSLPHGDHPGNRWDDRPSRLQELWIFSVGCKNFELTRVYLKLTYLRLFCLYFYRVKEIFTNFLANENYIAKVYRKVKSFLFVTFGIISAIYTVHYNFLKHLFYLIFLMVIFNGRILYLIKL